MVQDQHPTREKANKGRPDEAGRPHPDRRREKGWPLEGCLRLPQRLHNSRGFLGSPAQKQESENILRLAQQSESLRHFLPPANREEARNQAPPHEIDSRHARPRRSLSLEAIWLC